MAFIDRDLRPFRQYSEHDVVNLYSLEARATESLPVNKGTIVSLVAGKGWESSDELVQGAIHAKAATYNNTQNPRFMVQSKVYVHTGLATDHTLGLLLHDVRDEDENGELLIYNPRKAAEMQASVSGQVVPIAKKGVFLYDGFVGTADAGTPVYIATNGRMGDAASSAGGQNVRVGTCLGAADADGNVLIDFNPTAML